MIDVRLDHRLGAFRLDVEFTAPAQGITALYGPSGAGKSTILHALAGLLRPDAGRVVVDGEVLLDVAGRIEVPAHRRRVGCVFQDARLFPHLDVEANLRFGHRRQARPAPESELDALIDLLDLHALRRRRPATLSGGERQRVALARSLLAGPRLLLLDEPLASLDPTRRREALGYLERLRSRGGVPMLYVSHREEEIARLADTVVMVDDGRVVGSGPVAETLTAPDFTRHFRTVPTTVLDARVIDQLEDWALTRIASPCGELTLPRVELPPGAELRLGIRADDVMLARGAPAEISANNIIEGRVEHVGTGDGPWVDVRVAIGEASLVARITRRSLDRLELGTDDAVHAVIKTATVHRS